MAGSTRIGSLAGLKSWFSNSIDEAEQATTAGRNYLESKYIYNKLPAPMKTPQKTKALKEMKERVREERGQYFGALLQGRQYDGSGKQIKSKQKK
jgi:hypothetical protein